MRSSPVRVTIPRNRKLARGLAEIHGIKIDPERVQTNIIVFDVGESGQTPSVLVTELKRLGVLANAINSREVRMVTHKDVSRGDCEEALGVIRQSMEIH